MRDGYFRFLIFLVIFTAGFYAIVQTGSERMLFDDAKTETRVFLHTMCRMGEVSKASLTTFLNALPKGRGVIDVKIECRRENGDKKTELFIGNDRISEGLNRDDRYRFELGDEIMLRLAHKDHVFFCVGRVNGSR